MELQRTFWKQGRLKVQSDSNRNDLELLRSFWHKDAFVCIIVKHSETIFETAIRRNSKCFDLIKGVWSRPRARNPGFIENKDGDWCIRMLFETIIWPAEKILKAVKVNGAFWRFLRPMLDDFWGRGGWGRVPGV